MSPGSVARLLAAAVVLNWGWEMAQMPAYAEMAGRSWASTAWRCLGASAGDAALTLPLSIVAVRLAPRPPATYAAAAVLGAAAAVLIEWTALSHGSWSYSDRMPIVPLTGVGLWPLLQLTVLVPAALLLARRRNVP